MNQFRVVTVLSLSILAVFVGIADLQAQAQDPADSSAKKQPDISGEWISESPLDFFVEDDSPQPVNTFRIDRSKEADFDAKYLGSRGASAALKWVEKSGQFEGTQESRRGKTTFVVVPTDVPDVLICTIHSDSIDHKDRWMRRNAKATATKEHAADKTTVLVYEDHAELTQQMKDDTEELLAPYAEFLKRQGFPLQKGQVVLRLQAGMNNAHYYHTNRSIVMGPTVVEDKSVMRREYNHHALAVVLGTDAQEIFQACSGIESGLADYFGCSAADDPAVGLSLAGGAVVDPNRRPLRTMENQLNFSTIQNSSGRHAVGEVLCGALWEMRESIGRRIFDHLLLKAWVGIVKSDASNGQVARFATSLLKAAQKEDPEHVELIQDIFERRGLTLR